MENIIQNVYVPVLNEAAQMMELGLEPRSALKQAASDRGLEWGDDMGDFVEWAEFQLYGK